ncbi:hypothetical protein [Methanosarcina acetivorans]|nr:hypothetical protein [Methanosarcina acetivorans]
MKDNVSEMNMKGNVGKMNMKDIVSEALKIASVGGIVSGLITAALNYYVIPFPETIISNVIGHGVGGFVGASTAGFIGIMIYARQIESKIQRYAIRRIT